MLAKVRGTPPWKSSPTREKNWKLMYTRSEKLARARQLGFDDDLNDRDVEVDA